MTNQTNLSVSQTAVHEAAHFVMDQWYKLGRSRSLTIIARSDFVGCYSSAGPVFSHFLRCAAQKRLPSINDPEMRGVSPASFKNSLEAYGFLYRAYAFREIIANLAGEAAEREICGMPSLIAEHDNQEALWKAEVYQPKETSAALVDGLRGVARTLCGGHLKPAILAVATELEKKKTLNEAELAALWQRFDPGKTPPWPSPNARSFELGPV